MKIRPTRRAAALMIALAAITSCSQPKTAETGKTLPTWQTGELDIHFINTGRGECTYQIFPDGTTMLVDASGSLLPFGKEESEPLPARPSSDVTAGKVISEYIRHFSPAVSKGHINYFLLTHYDGDHIGSCNDTVAMHESGKFRLGSIEEIGTNFIFDNIFDRSYPEYDYPTAKALDNFKMHNYRAFLEWTKETNGTKVEKWDVGSRTQVKLLHSDNYDFVVRNYSGNGVFYTGRGNETVSIMPDKEAFAAAGKKALPKENAFSCSYMLSYGEFDLFMGGDLQINGRDEYPYKDTESPVARAAHKVEVMKANHHGTLHTNSDELLAVLEPETWIVCPWRDVHPRPSTIDRVLQANPECKIFSTNMPEINREVLGEERLGKLCAESGHIVVRVAKGGNSYMVYVLDDTDMDYRVKGIFGPYPCYAAFINRTVTELSSREMYDTDTLNLYSTYRAYPTDIPEQTAAPAGYKPFYVSSYNRHGSRKLDNYEYSKTSRAILEAAEKEGKLTEYGKSVLKKVQTIDDDLALAKGNLSTLGREQHWGIARRMAEAYPEIFKADGKEIHCFTTEIQRTILSMFSQIGALYQANPSLKISYEATEKNTFLRGKYDSPYKDNRQRPIDEYIAEHLDPTNAFNKLFGENWPEIEKPSSFIRCLYFTGGIVHGTDIPETAFLRSLFNPDELYTLHCAYNYMMYMKLANSPVNGYSTMPAMVPMLRDFIERTDKAIEDRNIGADLRFGHDSYLIPYVCLLGIEGYDRVETDYVRIEEAFKDYIISPMAGNIRWVLYDGKDGDILVKIMLNENEVHIPVATDMYPYYHWSDVRSYYLSLADSLIAE